MKGCRITLILVLGISTIILGQQNGDTCTCSSQETSTPTTKEPSTVETTTAKLTKSTDHPSTSTGSKTTTATKTEPSTATTITGHMTTNHSITTADTSTTTTYTPTTAMTDLLPSTTDTSATTTTTNPSEATTEPSTTAAYTSTTTDTSTATGVLATTDTSITAAYSSTTTDPSTRSNPSTTLNPPTPTTTNSPATTNSSTPTSDTSTTTNPSTTTTDLSAITNPSTPTTTDTSTTPATSATTYVSTTTNPSTPADSSTTATYPSTTAELSTTATTTETLTETDPTTTAELSTTIGPSTTTDPYTTKGLLTTTEKLTSTTGSTATTTDPSTAPPTTTEPVTTTKESETATEPTTSTAAESSSEATNTSSTLLKAAIKRRQSERNTYTTGIWYEGQCICNDGDKHEVFPVDQLERIIPLQLKVESVIFQTELLNRSSENYRNFTGSFFKKLIEAYSDTNVFMGVEITGFRNGCVIVDHNAKVYGGVKPSKINETIVTALENMNGTTIYLYNDNSSHLMVNVDSTLVSLEDALNNPDDCAAFPNQCPRGYGCLLSTQYFACIHPCTVRPVECSGNGHCYFDQEDNQTLCRCNDDDKYIYIGINCETKVERLVLSSTYIIVIAAASGGVVIMALLVVIICMARRRERRDPKIFGYERSYSYSKKRRKSSVVVSKTQEYKTSNEFILYRQPPKPNIYEDDLNDSMTVDGWEHSVIRGRKPSEAFDYQPKPQRNNKDTSNQTYPSIPHPGFSEPGVSMYEYAMNDTPFEIQRPQIRKGYLSQY